jgi:hypothetical protein
MKHLNRVLPLAFIALAAALGTASGCSSGKCNAASCQLGCCDVHGICQAGNTGALCGTGGAACAACQYGQTCQAGACFGCGTCDGCCAGATCISLANETSAQCGGGADAGLAACIACDGGQSCGGGGCLPSSCTPANCQGCCAGTTCIARASETFTQCGVSAASGAACVQCNTGQSCVSGACSGGNHDAGSPGDAGPPNVFCTPCGGGSDGGSRDAGNDAGSDSGTTVSDAGSDGGSDGGGDAGAVVVGNVCCSDNASGGSPPFTCSNACSVGNALTCGSPAGCPPSMPFCCANIVVDGGAIFPYCNTYTAFGATCAASCPVHLTLSCMDDQQVQFCRTMSDCSDPSYTVCCQLIPVIGDAGSVPLRLCVNSTVAKTLALQCF